MLRRYLALLLMLLVPLQAYSAVAGFALYSSDANLQHLADHEQSVAHHHHDDGSIQHDNSDKSLQHLSQHAGCLSFAAITANVQIPAMPVCGRGVSYIEPPSIRQTVLDSLFRPPRSFG